MSLHLPFRYRKLLMTVLLMAIVPLASARQLSTTSQRLSAHPMYLSFGVGGLTYIGNEDIGEACFNGLGASLYTEWGYSLTPEIFIAFNLNLFTAQSQTRYRLNPYVDFSQETVGDDGYWPYKSFNLYGATLSGLLVLDWTNIISGRDNNQAKLHILTPIGMGVTLSTGSKENPWTDYRPLNNEFTLTTGLTFNYRLNTRLDLVCSPRIYIHRGSLDYSPYSNNESSRFDMIPVLTLGIRFTMDARIPWITR